MSEQQLPFDDVVGTIDGIGDISRQHSN